jgi:dUTP pyrophosphatase
MIGVDMWQDGQIDSRFVKVRFVRTHPNAKLPTKGTEDAVGFDLYAVEQTTLEPGKFSLISTGWNVAIPKGYEGQVRSRSGLAAKFGVFVLNAPGTIDPDYRGSLGVILCNVGPNRVLIQPGERVAQLVVAPVMEAAMVEVEAFSDDTARGTGGFGSTGR